MVSRNPNFTMEYIIEFIKTNLNWNWYFDEVSSNPNVTIEFIEKDIFIWDWREFSKNPNVTMEFIKIHFGIIGIGSEIIRNNFPKNKELFMIEEAKKYMAVYKIKKWWKEIYYSPNTINR